jgi:hypothetical protein
MLDEFNPLVKQFRIARDRLAEHGDEEIGIRVVGAEEGDPVQYEMPTASELSGLIIGDFSQENYKRDIIVHATDGRLADHIKFRVSTSSLVPTALSIWRAWLSAWDSLPRYGF